MKEHEEQFMLPEKEPTSDYDIKVIAPEGLGFGEGTISVQEQLEHGDLSEASLRAAIEIVLSDDEVYVPVDKEADDDGCGDGRFTGKIYKLLDPVTKKVQEFKRSLRRAKLFGGGLVASSSMWRAVAGQPLNGETLMGDRQFLAEELKRRGVSHGAHTDSKATGEFCGCGAIDKYEPISRNVSKFRSQITSVLGDLYGDDFEENRDAAEMVLDMYEELDGEYFAGASGKKTMEFIENEGAIVKQLEGEHLEDMVVLNDVEGTTLDQQKLREKLIERGLSPNIQAFVVDIWRGRMYAELVADIAAERGMDRDDAQKRAYADFLIRTIAVSSTLTRGDQPVILRAKKSDVALAA